MGQKSYRDKQCQTADISSELVKRIKMKAHCVCSSIQILSHFGALRAKKPSISQAIIQLSELYLLYLYGSSLRYEVLRSI